MKYKGYTIQQSALDPSVADIIKGDKLVMTVGDKDGIQDYIQYAKETIDYLVGLPTEVLDRIGRTCR